LNRYNAKHIDHLHDEGIKTLIKSVVEYVPNGAKIVQHALNMLGYDLKVDGWLGDKTIKAIERVRPQDLNAAIGIAIDQANGNISQKDRVKALIREECEHYGVHDSNQIAYIYATIEWETAHTWKPVREAYWVLDKYVRKYGDKKGKKKYDEWAKRHFRYYPFYGRGFVQITWKRNYQKFSKILSKRYGKKINLVKYPDLALNEKYAATIAVYGMKHGTFTGKKLDDYIGWNKADFVGARKIINGTDKAKRIALIADSFELDA